MIEVEIKIKIEDENQWNQNLAKLQFKPGDVIEESDLYFNSQYNDLRKQDMALRIRSSLNQTTGQQLAMITYKGPKMDSISMTRQELEIQVEDGEIGREILTAIGYDQIYPVKKLRRYYHNKEGITACIDRVENLGTYLELEMLEEKEENREAALGRLMQTLEQLGCQRQQMIRTSYLSMLQQKENV